MQSQVFRILPAQLQLGVRKFLSEQPLRKQVYELSEVVEHFILSK